MRNLSRVLSAFKTKKILVIGDLMLDHYIWGKVDRISPEAPVPVLDVINEEYRPGGAANVALNVKALGADVMLCGVVGKDEAGAVLTKLLGKQGIDFKDIVTDKNRPTTKKTRIGAVSQQIVRIDIEHREEIPPMIEKRLLTHIKSDVSKADAVILEDYNKGLLTGNLIAEVINYAKKCGKLITADPKQKNFFNFEKVDLFKPNYSELQKNLGIIIDTEKEFERHAKLTRARMKCKYLVVTRGEKGLYIFTDKNQMHHIPTFAREVYDVSGAGDTVISAITLALSTGCDIKTAAIIANHAAGVVCRKLGTATASIQEIAQSYNEHQKDN